MRLIPEDIRINQTATLNANPQVPPDFLDWRSMFNSLCLFVDPSSILFPPSKVKSHFGQVKPDTKKWPHFGHLILSASLEEFKRLKLQLLQVKAVGGKSDPHCGQFFSTNMFQILNASFQVSWFGCSQFPLNRTWLDSSSSTEGHSY